LDDSGPFSPEQWRDIQALVQQLDAAQAMWLSGYLAGRPFTQPAAAPTASVQAAVWVLYGSETGNSEAVAQWLGQQLEAAGIGHKVLPLARVKPRELKRADYLLTICSTHGDGDPPEPALDFFDGLERVSAGALAGTRHAVLALGDSSYEHYCTAGHTLHNTFTKLGSEPLQACTEADVDFEQIAQHWCQQVQGQLPSAPQASDPAPQTSAPQPASAATAPSRDHPVAAEVLENLCLSAATRRKPIHHLELLIEPGTLAVTPGDAIGVIPNNPPALVAQMLELSGFSGDEPVMQKDRALTVVEAFRERVDLTVPSPALLALWASASDNQALKQIAEADKKAQREFLKTTSVVGLLASAPVLAAIEPQAFIEALRPLQPRLYDVANLVDEHSDELHITVKDYRYSLAGQEHTGITSEYLRHLEPGEHARIYVHANKRFRLPEALDAPLIFIAQATGIAPYRAFIQSLSERPSSPPVWLFLQETQREEDFLYQTDWQQAHQDGLLTHINTLFTADQPDTSLADVLAERASELVSWISQGAHLYICGEKLALNSIDAELKALCDKSDDTVWHDVKAQKRLHKNLY
jgi:sulfite reductase (NADPH) flavoprotein alpha-component